MILYIPRKSKEKYSGKNGSYEFHLMKKLNSILCVVPNIQIARQCRKEI